jgi:hypothetical protein
VNALLLLLLVEHPVEEGERPADGAHAQVGGQPAQVGRQGVARRAAGRLKMDFLFFLFNFVFGNIFFKFSFH